MQDRQEAILTLGPVLFLWEGPKWRDFYLEIADEAPIDIVFLGEVVCSKRSHFTEPHFAEVVERLKKAGKRVALSSLALATQLREVEANRALARQDEFPVEANDLSLLSGLGGKRHFIGPFVNVYNAATANFLASRGAQSICLPPELPLSSIRAITQTLHGADLEVFTFGRAPLAISARCAHARAKGNTKDNCQFVCGQDPDGLPVTTLSEQPFLAINGVQTMSHAYHSALGEMRTLLGGGVRRFRLSPQKTDMVKITEIHRDVLSANIDADQGRRRLTEICAQTPIANGFLYGAAGAELWADGNNVVSTA